jgi:cyclopropane fatty-acyl-phospholipid synthase-like methyltransferase
LPASRILEIAPGYGRWTRFLLRYCSDAYLGIDLSQECVAHCRKAFAAAAHARFDANDGYSLASVPEGQFDLIFSYDSLVHVETDVHASYIPQMINKLSQDGVAFIHHSNLGAYSDVGEPTHARGVSVSADFVADLVIKSGGLLLLQETHTWGGSQCLLDCVTVFARSGSSHLGTARRIENHNFSQETRNIKNHQSWYSKAIG